MSTTETQRRVAYIATIRRDGDEYVARDESGSRRASVVARYCDTTTADRLAISLFGPKAVGCARVSGNAIEVEIMEEPLDTHRLGAASIYIRDAILVDLDNLHSAACHSNPLLAHCLERILIDLRKSADELAMLATLTKGGE